MLPWSTKREEDSIFELMAVNALMVTLSRVSKLQAILPLSKVDGQ